MVYAYDLCMKNAYFIAQILLAYAKPMFQVTSSNQNG